MGAKGKIMKLPNFQKNIVDEMFSKCKLNIFLLIMGYAKALTYIFDLRAVSGEIMGFPVAVSLMQL